MITSFAFMNIGGQELILILLILLILFGAKKLPELARGMGQAIKEFQKSKDEFTDEVHTPGKREVAAETDVRSNTSVAPTVPRMEDAALERDVLPVANQAAEPRRQG